MEKVVTLWDLRVQDGYETRFKVVDALNRYFDDLESLKRKAELDSEFLPFVHLLQNLLYVRLYFLNECGLLSLTEFESLVKKVRKM